MKLSFVLGVVKLDFVTLLVSAVEDLAFAPTTSLTLPTRMSPASSGRQVLWEYLRLSLPSLSNSLGYWLLHFFPSLLLPASLYKETQSPSLPVLTTPHLHPEPSFLLWADLYWQLPITCLRRHPTSVFPSTNSKPLMTPSPFLHTCFSIRFHLLKGSILHLVRNLHLMYDSSKSFLYLRTIPHIQPLGSTWA